VYDVVFNFALTAEVGVEHLPDGRGPVGEAHVLYTVTAREEVLDQEGTLSGFTAAVQAFEDK
jgi:hypothetical protein